MYTQRGTEEAHPFPDSDDTTPRHERTGTPAQPKRMPDFDREKFIEEMHEKIGCYRGSDSALVKNELSKIATVMLKNQSTALLALHEPAKKLIKTSEKTPKEICKYLNDFLKSTASPSWICKIVTALQVTLEHEHLLKIQDVEKIYMLGRLPNEAIELLHESFTLNKVDIMSCSRQQLAAAIRQFKGTKPKKKASLYKQIVADCNRWLKEGQIDEELAVAISDLRAKVENFAAK